MRVFGLMVIAQSILLELNWIKFHHSKKGTMQILFLECQRNDLQQWVGTNAKENTALPSKTTTITKNSIWPHLVNFVQFCHWTSNSREAEDFKVQGSCRKKGIIATTRMCKGTEAGQVHQNRADQTIKPLALSIRRLRELWLKPKICEECDEFDEHNCSPNPDVITREPTFLATLERWV